MCVLLYTLLPERIITYNCTIFKGPLGGEWGYRCTFYWYVPAVANLSQVAPLFHIILLYFHILHFPSQVPPTIIRRATWHHSSSFAFLNFSVHLPLPHLLSSEHQRWRELRPLPSTSPSRLPPFPPIQSPSAPKHVPFCLPIPTPLFQAALLSLVSKEFMSAHHTHLILVPLRFMAILQWLTGSKFQISSFYYIRSVFNLSFTL